MSEQVPTHLLWAHQLQTQHASLLKRLEKLEAAQVAIEVAQAMPQSPRCSHAEDVNSLRITEQAQDHRLAALESALETVPSNHQLQINVANIMRKLKEFEEATEESRTYGDDIEHLGALSQGLRNTIVQMLEGMKSISNRQEELTGFHGTLMTELAQASTNSGNLADQIFVMENKLENLLSTSGGDRGSLHTMRLQMKALSVTTKSLEESFRSLSIKLLTLEGQAKRSERQRENSIAETSTTEGSVVEGIQLQDEYMPSTRPDRGVLRKRSFEMVDATNEHVVGPVPQEISTSQLITPAVVKLPEPSTPEKDKSRPIEQTSPLLADRFGTMRKRAEPGFAQQTIAARNRRGEPMAVPLAAAFLPPPPSQAMIMRHAPRMKARRAE